MKQINARKWIEKAQECYRSQKYQDGIGWCDEIIVESKMIHNFDQMWCASALKLKGELLYALALEKRDTSPDKYKEAARCREEANRIINESNPYSGPCFIATAAYGNPLANQLYVLRRYRDYYLIKRLWGKCFISLYYFVGPFLAVFVKQSKIIRRITISILDYIIKKISTLKI